MSTVFFDIDTQIDFVFPAGALYVPGAERILPKVAALNRYAVSMGLPLISTMDAHAENDVEFRLWPPHCVVDTFGQRKAAVTLMEGNRQVFIEKQTVDCFSNPKLDELLREWKAAEAVVYGVATDICVAIAVRGLLARGVRVTVVQDAVAELNGEAAQNFEAELLAAGGQLVVASQICALD